MGRPVSGRTRTCRNLSIDKGKYSQLEELSDILGRPISRLIDEAIALVISNYKITQQIDIKEE